MVWKQDTNIMVWKQDEPLPPTPSTISKPNPSAFLFRDKVFQNTVSLIDDDSNSTQNMLLANEIHTILDVLIIPFKDIEGMDFRVNNKCIQLSIDSTNRIKLSQYFHMHNERMKVPLNMTDWMNLNVNELIKFCVSYQVSDYTVDVNQ